MTFNISQRRLIIVTLLAVAVFISILYIKECIIAIPLLLTMSVKRRTSRLELHYCTLTSIVFMFLIKTGSIRFSMFPQAADLFYKEESLVVWMKSGHIHAVRLAIVYPGVILARILGMSTNMGVTLYSSSLMILMLDYMIRIFQLNSAETRKSSILSSLLLLALAHAMNGRLIYVFFGTTLLLLYELKFREGETSIIPLQLITILSLVLSMVSSGTMMVVLIYIILISPFRWKILQSKKQRLEFLLIALAYVVPAVTILLPYVSSMVLKNVNYYGGGIYGTINLLHHGLGRFININNVVILTAMIMLGLLVILINICFFNANIMKLDYPELPLFLIINLSIYGSLVGISTGLTALIPFMIMCIKRINKTIRIA